MAVILTVDGDSGQWGQRGVMIGRCISVSAVQRSTAQYSAVHQLRVIDAIVCTVHLQNVGTWATVPADWVNLSWLNWRCRTGDTDDRD